MSNIPKLVSKITLPDGDDINIKDSTAVRGLSSGTNQNNLVKWGSDGYTVADAGVAIQSDTISTQDNTKVPTNKAVASFVNSSVATNTANFVGTYKSLAELQAVQNPTNNDYGFVSTVDSAILTTSQPADWTTNYTDYYTYSGGVYTPVTGSSAPTWQENTYYKADNFIFSRYKYIASSTTWSYEYELNNSSFTAAEWDTIQSGLSANDKEKLDSLATIKSVGSGLGLNGTTGELTADVIGVKGDSESNYRTGNVNITKANIGLGNVTNDAQVKKINSSTSGNIMTWSGTTGDTPADSGVSIETRSSGISDSDTKIPTSKDIRNNVAGSANLTGYTKATGNVAASDTITTAIGKLETKADTNTSILSQTYNSADCNMYLVMLDDTGDTNGTYYNVSENKMYFRIRWNKNQYKYWSNGTDYYKYKINSVGLIATNNSTKANELTLETLPVTNETYVKINYYTGATEDDGSLNYERYTWAKSSSSIGDIWYIRPHIEYTDLETGMEYTMYGAVYKVTAGVPCIIECNTLSCTELTAKEQSNEDNILTVADQSIMYNHAIDSNFSGTIYKVAKLYTLKANTAYVICFGSLTSTDTDSSVCSVNLYNNGVSVMALGGASRGNNVIINVTPTGDANELYVYASNSYQAGVGDTVTVTNLMIIEKSLWDAGFTDYQPYALSNVELTAAEKQNETNISSLYNSGQKNHLSINTATYTASGSNRALKIPVDSISGTIHIYFSEITSTDTDDTTCAVLLVDSNDNTIQTIQFGRGANKDVSVYVGSTAVASVSIYPASDWTNSANDTVSITNGMICTQEAWGATGGTFEPYAMSNAELTSMLGDINTVLEGVL